MSPELLVFVLKSLFPSGDNLFETGDKLSLSGDRLCSQELPELFFTISQYVRISPRLLSVFKMSNYY